MDQRLEIVSGVCLMFFADLIFFDSSIKSSSSQLRKFFGQSRLTYPDDSRFSQAWHSVSRHQSDASFPRSGCGSDPPAFSGV